MNQPNPEAREALSEARTALRAGQRNPPLIQLSRDPREAVAFAMAVIRGDSELIGKRDALDQLANRIDQLLDTSNQQIVWSRTAEQLPQLSARDGGAWATGRAVYGGFLLQMDSA